MGETNFEPNRVLAGMTTPAVSPAVTQLNLSTDGMVLTLIVNVGIFCILLMFFEANRLYKQIFQKRLQKRFINTGRVPAEPPDHIFGWFTAIWKVPEYEFLNMVGLDAYMLLRYHVLCIKLTLFITMWSLIVLLPVYSTVDTGLVNWDRYTLMNLQAGSITYWPRLWVTAIVFYVFAAYFCQLLYTEYQNFSNLRLMFLGKDDPKDDPDTHPQTYYTVMCESLPPELRSVEKLAMHFEELFPGEVYTVELALDLRELNGLICRRRDIQNKLEKAIALYNVIAPKRPLCSIRTRGVQFNMFDYGKEDNDDSVFSFFAQFIAPDRYGYEKLDAINYYTARLRELNDECKALQSKCFEKSKDMDKDIQRKLKNKFDTRAAEAMEHIGNASRNLIENMSSEKGNWMTSWLFGEEQNIANQRALRKAAMGTSVLDDGIDDLMASNKKMQSSSIPKGMTPKKAGVGSERARPKSEVQYDHVDNPLHAHTLENDERESENTAQTNAHQYTAVTEFEEIENPLHRGDVDSLDNPVPPSTSPPAPTSHETIDKEQKQEQDQGDGKDIEMGTSEVDVVGRRLSSTEDDAELASVMWEQRPDNAHKTTSHSQPSSRGVSPSSAAPTPPPATELKTILPIKQATPNFSAHKTLDAEAEAEDAIENLEEGNSTQYGHHRTASVSSQASGVTSNQISKQQHNRRRSSLRSLLWGGEGGSGNSSEENLESLAGGSTKAVDALGVGSKMIGRIAQNIDQEAVERAKLTAKEGWKQTKIAGVGAFRGVLEAERAFEMIVVGAHYEFSSTAFVTFKSRMAETIAHQMNLTDESAMEIHHAPNPNDIIWENIAIPKSQVVMRNTITNIGLVIGAFFWSSLVNSVNQFAKSSQLGENQQNFLSVCILLFFLLILPFVFDFLARNYECMKLESEVQNSIMTRYFYYQLVNIYVTVGLGGLRISDQVLLMLKNPQTLVELLGKTIPSVSLYFTNLVIVKTFAAIPVEMLRPWQLSTILLIGTCMDRRKTTRRELRTGAFFAWPMLYGWIYPQLMMVQMIVITNSCVAPLLMPFGALFFFFSYFMYKYQLLYVYVNDYQSHGYMWYAVFNYSIIALLFATAIMLGYLGLHLVAASSSGPFFILLPLPVCIVYFWHYCQHVFKRKMDLSFQRAKYIDNINESKKEKGHPIPQDSFKKHLFRQPTLTEGPQYPEKYRLEKEDEFLEKRRKRHNSSIASIGSIGEASVGSADGEDTATDHKPAVRMKRKSSTIRGRASSLNIDALDDGEGEETPEELQEYFELTVLGTLVKPTGHPHEEYRPPKSTGDSEV